MGIYHTRKCEVLSDMRTLIKSEKIVIFLTSFSIESFQALELLKYLSLAPFIVNIEEELNISQTRQGLFSLTGSYELPQIFITGYYYGSLKELRKGIKYSTLQRLLLRYGIKYTDYDCTKELLTR